MSGFFSYYGLLGLGMFIGALLGGLIVSWICKVFFKTYWVFPVVQLIIAFIFYYIAMTFTAFLFVFVAIIFSLILIIRKAIKK
jgi:hypothetical protein